MTDTVQAYLVGVISGVFLLAGILVTFMNLREK